VFIHVYIITHNYNNNKHRTEYSEPSVAVECKKTNYLAIFPTVKETLCTHLSTIRDKWWLFLLTGVIVGGILIGLIVFAAVKSKEAGSFLVLI
jgi:hypothetical protein